MRWTRFRPEGDFVAAEFSIGDGIGAGLAEGLVGC
jgi:hypothetical protein